MITPTELKLLNISGLTSNQVHRSAARYGHNLLKHAKKRTIISQLLGKFFQPLVILLMFASTASFLLGETIDAMIIAWMVGISVVIDFFQEYKSEKAAEELQKKVSLKTTVFRDQELLEIPVSHLVIDDIVFLTAGSIVPADLEALFVRDLHVDESLMTGESFPAEKLVNSSLLMGTSLVNGEVVARVVKIGSQTEYGKIAWQLEQQKPTTDFEKGIHQLSLLVMKLTMVLVVIVFIINALGDTGLFQSMLFAVALAVGLTPELLPVILTVNLSKGAIRLSRQGVIVKHLPAIQNFGSMNILCSDKTGTLTENKITLRKYENLNQDHDPHVLLLTYLNSRFQSSIRNALDEAVLEHKHEISTKGYRKIDEIPFDFTRKRLSVIFKYEQKHVLICKGSVEELIQLIKCVENNGVCQPMNATLHNQLRIRYHQLSREGFRVLAIVYKQLDHNSKYTKEDEHDLTFAGFTAFYDPPKQGVKEVIDDLEDKGVELKILTGDNELIARKVCQELGIPIKGVLIGKQLSTMTDKQLEKVVDQTSLFARLTPEHKYRIINALRKRGHVVGYLGDGINDAPPLKAADVGISVANAVDVAAQAADLILMHKSLKVLGEGIVEGRKTFVNTEKYIHMAFSSNFGNMVSFSVASIVLPFLPMLPTQLLLNNLIYDFSQLALPTDNVDPEQLKQPRRWNMQFLKKFILVFGPISSIFDIGTFLILMKLFDASAPLLRTGWFIESVVTQGLIILAIRTKAVPFWKSQASKWVVLTAALAALAGILVAVLPVGRYFEFVTLPGSCWLMLWVILAAYFLTVETAKWWFYRWIQKLK